MDELTPEDRKARLKQIKEQRAHLQDLSDQLKLQADQLGFSERYGDVDEMRKVDQTYADISKRLQDVPIDFAKATGQQLMGDLGISGEGAIPNSIQAALEWGKKRFTVDINVSSVEDAIKFKEAQQKAKDDDDDPDPQAPIGVAV